MVKVTFKPWEEVVIHDSIQYSLDNLVTIRSLGAQTGGLGNRLLWAEGVAFIHTGMAPTQEVVKEKLMGRVHWSSVEWALMPVFKPFVEIPQTKVRIPILNFSANKIISDVARALKKSAQQI